MALAARAVRLGCLVGLVVVLTAAPSVAAPYEPSDPPVVQADRAHDARVVHRWLDRTELTSGQARAADLTRVRFAVVDHDGEPSAEISVQLRRVLRDAPRRHTQGVRISFDEETYVETLAHSGRSRYLSSYGGSATPQAGCTRLDATTRARTITQWVPLRCLATDTSEMTTEGLVWATRSDGRAKRRLVGSDTTGRDPAFIRWR